MYGTSSGCVLALTPTPIKTGFFHQNQGGFGWLPTGSGPVVKPTIEQCDINIVIIF